MSASASELLPMPAGPVSSTTPPCPLLARSQASARLAVSRARPTRGASSLRARPDGSAGASDVSAPARMRPASSRVSGDGAVPNSARSTALQRAYAASACARSPDASRRRISVRWVASLSRSDDQRAAGPVGCACEVAVCLRSIGQRQGDSGDPLAVVVPCLEHPVVGEVGEQDAIGEGERALERRVVSQRDELVEQLAVDGTLAGRGDGHLRPVALQVDATAHRVERDADRVQRASQRRPCARVEHVGQNDAASLARACAPGCSRR